MDGLVKSCASGRSPAPLRLGGATIDGRARPSIFSPFDWPHKVTPGNFVEPPPRRRGMNRMSRSRRSYPPGPRSRRGIPLRIVARGGRAATLRPSGDQKAFGAEPARRNRQQALRACRGSKRGPYGALRARRGVVGCPRRRRGPAAGDLLGAKPKPIPAYNSSGLGLMSPGAAADEAEKLLAGGFSP